MDNDVTVLPDGSAFSMGSFPQKAYFLDDDSDRLKPCPFCGGDAEFGEISGSHFVQCTSSACGAASARIFPPMDDVKALLLERWNRRPNAAGQRGA